MSVQLILFPQNYEGRMSTFTGDPNQIVVNGTSFNGLSIASSTTTNNSFIGFYVLNMVNANPATVPNTWYRYRWGVGSSFPDLPTDSGNNAIFDILSQNGASGIYQRVTNLTIGTQYKFSVIFGSFTAGKVQIYDVRSSSTVGGNFIFPGSSSYTLTFTAQATTTTIAIVTSSYSSTVGNITIQSVSLLDATIAPSQTTNLLGDGQVICDLYEDEEIPLTLSVDEFKNAAEQVQSYSKAFMLPGTKRNNQIFENLFEITRSSLGNQGALTFNPYAKTQCILKQDGLVLFEGYLKMIDIQDQEKEISYNVNLYSQVTTLADILQDKKFNDIDFQELAHTYDKDSIKNSWFEPL